jgi:hypothetical protein
MRRIGRSLRGALAVVGLTLVPGVAWAQTTTTTSSTSSTSTSAMSNSQSQSGAPVPTTTTVAHPCTGQPCTTEPPALVLSSSTAQIEADQGSYCWHRPADPTGSCRALAVVPGYKPPLLVVTEGELITARFTAPVPGAPGQVSLADNGALTPLTAANPTSFRVDFAPGLHERLAVITRWVQGEVPYHFRLDVRRATTPAVASDGRQIALTG